MAQVTVGTQLGRYEVIAQIGAGGMADVYLAVARGPAGFNKLAVIKMLKPRFVEEAEFVEMFLNEARLAARLNHPNIVQTYEVGEQGDAFFLCMEYLEGVTLQRLVRRGASDAAPPFPLQFHLRVLADALAGLHYAHALQDYDGVPLRVVHRDVTPHNIMVTCEGSVKLLDFGIAKAATAAAETLTGVMKGKVPYMSPEQVRGDTLDGRSDLFAVGVMLWEALAGRRLWVGVSDMLILQRLLQGDYPRVRDVAPDVDPELEAICSKAMAFRPADRYETAADFQTAIEDHLEMVTRKIPARDFGAFVTDLHGEERKAIQQVIDKQLQELSQSKVGQPLHSLPRLGQTGPNPSLDSVPTSPSTSNSPGASASLFTSQNAVASSIQTAGSSLAPPRRNSIAAWIGVSLTLVAAGVATSTLLSRAPAVQAAHPEPPVGASAPIPPATVSVRIGCGPSSAQLFLDDERLPSNPFAGSFQRSQDARVIRVEADGYVPQRRIVSFDTDLDLSLVLEKLPTIAVASVAPSRPPPRPAATPVGGRPRPKTTRPKTLPQLDKGDPWKQ